MSRPLRIGVDARLTSAEGGVGSFVIGLASGLSRLEGDEEYLFLTTPEHESWLQPYLTGRCRAINTRRRPSLTGALRRFAGNHARPLAEALGNWPPLAGSSTIRIPSSDGSVESAGVDVMHLTSQYGFFTEVPTIYHPHDLQHLHLPQYFTPRNRAKREIYYRGLCAQARLIAVSSAWTKTDLITQYGLPPCKISIVPLAPLLSEYPTPNDAALARTRSHFSLPERFVFYPAQTWPHKNHLALIDAIALLKQEGLPVSFVSSGKKTEFWPDIKCRAEQLGVANQVKFLGYVSALELQCLYQLSRCVVIPTKFEAASFPLWEAFLAGVPAACSTVTALPEQAGDAALLFNPDSTAEIADALRSLWSDESLRANLVERGRENVSRLSWERTARIFRAYYRHIGGRSLSEDDVSLLAETR